MAQCRQEKKTPSPTPAEQACGSARPPCRKRQIGIDDLTWSMMLMALREPRRESKSEERAAEGA
jgi:hypothetical protein